MNVIWEKVIVFIAFLVEGMLFGLLPIVVLKRVSPSVQKRILGVSNAFAGGLFLAAGFVHLLAESNEILTTKLETHYPYGLLLCSSGFLLAFFFEKVFFAQYHHHHEPTEEHYEAETRPPVAPVKEERSHLLGGNSVTHYGGHSPNTSTIRHHSHENHHHSHSHNESDSSDEEEANMPKEGHDHHLGNSIAPYILMIVLSLHSFISGMAVGVQPDGPTMWPLVIAIAAHKWVEAFAVGVSIIRLRVKKWKYVLLIGIYAGMEPIGVSVGAVLSVVLNSTDTTFIEAIVGSIASGTFIYVATIDILVEEFSREFDKYLKTVCCILGFGLMVALTSAFDHDHEGGDLHQDHDH